MREIHTQFPRIVFFLFIAIASFFPIKSFSGTTYLSGTVTLDGEAYTATTTSVYLTCQGSNWSYLSDYDQIDSDGAYSLSGGYSWNPCSSSYPNMSDYSCQVYAYQWSDNTITNSQYYDVDLTCGSTVTQDLALQRKDKRIDLTITSGSTPITAGMSGYCSQTTSPWTYSYSSEIDANGVISIPVIAGTYTCSAYCDWQYWYDSGETCPYSGYPQATVTIGADESTKRASLSFRQKDKQIKVFVYAGSNAVTDGIRVYCSQQESPWTWSEATSASSDNSYICQVTAGRYYVSASCSTWPCQYDGYPSTYVTVGENDSSAETELTYTVKDKTIRTTILAGTTQITNNVTASCYKNGGDWASTSDSSPNASGIYELQVGAGTHECYAYCTDWQNCDISGYPRATVTLEEADSTVDLTLTFFENNSTLSGVVSNGTDVYISIQADQLQSSSALSTSVSGGIRYATVTGGTAEKSQIYRSVTTSGSSFVTTVPAGTYKITAYPPYGTAYGQATTTVTTKANSTTTISLTFPEKTAQITGRLTDTDGNGIKGSVSAWTSYGSTTTNDWAWAETDDDGNYTLSVLEDVKYNVSAWPYTWDNSSSICTESSEGMQTVTASSTAQTVNFSYPFCDCTMTVNAVDGSGNILSQISASVNATPSSFDTNEHYYGIWGWISAGTGTVNVEEDREYKFSMWAWDNNYVAGDEVTATCADGSGSVDISFADVIDGAISGSFVDGDGSPVTISNNSYISVYATKGNTYRNCTTTTTGYSCDLSAGTWSFGYWIDAGSGFASAPAGTTSTDVVVTSAGGVSQDLTLLRTGYIDVIVLDHDQVTPRNNVWVEATPYSISEGENDYQYRYCSAGCSTDENGSCRISVGADSVGVTYYVNVYMPYTMKAEESVSNPKEQEISVTIGQASSVTLNYVEPDQTILISVVEGSSASTSLSKALVKKTEEPILLKQVLNATDSDASGPGAGATVDCFSNFGGSFQATTDTDGNATCPCVSGETWYVVTYNKVANALYLSEVTEATCDSTTTVQVAIDYVTTLPEGRTVTTQDVSTQTTSVELSDGFSVSFPPGSLGTTETQATVNVDTTVTPFTANKRPASFYAYSVNALDSNSTSITQLNVAATFRVPINKTQVENLGLSLSSVQASYFSESTGAYADVSNSVTTEDDGNSQSFVTFQQNHLTDFAVIGNGFLTGIQGETGEEIGIGDDGTSDSGDGGSAASGSGGCGCDFRRLSSASSGIPTVVLSLFCLGILFAFRQRQKRRV